MKESGSNGRQTTSTKKDKNYRQYNTAVKLSNGGGSRKGSLKLSSFKSKHSLTSKMGSNYSSSKSASKANSPKKGKAGSNKQSQDLRPRRRASQSYFFKYQLAKNPLRAEEKDLKLALFESLQQCSNNNYKNKKIKDNKNINKNGNKNGNKTGKRMSMDKVKKVKKVSKININASKTSKSSDSSSSSTINSPICSTNKDDLSGLTFSSSTSTYSTPEPNESSIHSTNEVNKPETEDFLSFICLRTTAPNYQNNYSNDTSSNTIIYTTPSKTNKNEINNNLRCNTNSTPTKFWNYNNNNTNNIHSPIANMNNRRPIRQSPRLANSNYRKISENNDTSNTIITANAYDNSITYEEDLKRASIALEDMAQEISCSSSETNNNEVAQKHLVKGLMTREFAGAFADEETIFESISNHKL